MKIGNRQLLKAYLGTKEILKIYSGANLVYSSLDVDAQAFITAAGIIDNTQKTAINNLVLGLKDNGTWSKYKAIYPIIGGTSDSHKYNLKDPRDLDVAYRLTYSGAFTHTSDGMLNNTTSIYANTHLVPINDLTGINNSHISFYSRTTGSLESIEIGSSRTTNYYDGLYMFIKWTDGSHYFNIQSTTSESEVVGAGGTGGGLVIASRINGTELMYLENGVVATDTDSLSNGLSTLPVYLCGGNIANTTPFGNLRQCAFASIGDGLTEIEMLADNDIIQAYQTELSREI